MEIHRGKGSYTSTLGDILFMMGGHKYSLEPQSELHKQPRNYHDNPNPHDRNTSAKATDLFPTIITNLVVPVFATDPGTLCFLMIDIAKK